MTQINVQKNILEVIVFIFRINELSSSYIVNA